MLKSFQEYVKSNQKLEAKPKVDLTADTGPTGHNLPKGGKKTKATKVSEKHKASESKFPPKFGDLKPFPYKATDAKVKVGEKGPADLGPKELIYEPDTKNKKVIKSENFIAKTKNLNLEQFTEFMVNECGCAVSEQTAPYELIKKVAKLSLENHNVFESLVLEFKRNGNLNELTNALLENYDFCSNLKNIIGENKDHWNKLNNVCLETMSKHESVGPPIGMDDNDVEDEDGKKKHDDENAEDDEDMDGENDDDDLDDDDDIEDDENLDDEDEDMDGEPSGETPQRGFNPAGPVPSMNQTPMAPPRFMRR